MKKVLIVDDTKNIRILLTTCLELKGFTVLAASSGQTALDILESEKNNIELIFLDIRMPEMNGTEVLKEIKRMNINCHIVIMTAFATIKNAVDCTKLGAAIYLQKPFSPERVNAIINELFPYNSLSIKHKTSDDKTLSYINKAKFEIEEENYSEAFSCLKTALSINPYNKDIYLLISILNDKTNNKKEALIFKKIFELFN